MQEELAVVCTVDRRCSDMLVKYQNGCIHHAHVADFRQPAAGKDKEHADSLLSLPEARQVNRGRSATDIKGT